MIIARQHPTHPLRGLGAALGAARRGRGCCDGGSEQDDCCSTLRGALGATRSIRYADCCSPGNPCCDDVFGSRMLRGPLDVFESPLWTHRKWIVLGGVALIGLSLMAGGAALLR